MYGNIYFNEWNDGVPSVPEGRSLDRRETGVTKIMPTENGHPGSYDKSIQLQGARMSSRSLAGSTQEQEGVRDGGNEATALGNTSDPDTATYRMLTIGQISVQCFTSVSSFVPRKSQEATLLIGILQMKKV